MRHVVAVTGLGMRSSIGDDVIDSCAALRAGTTRARELRYATVINEDGTPEHPVGHPVEAVQGFRGEARLLALARPVLNELSARTGLRGAEPERTGFYLALPPAPSSQEGAAQRTPSSDFHAPLARLTAWTLRPELSFEVRQGHAGFSLLVERACLELMAGRLDRCIVGGVDSLLDGDTLQTLHAKRRLKSQDAPDGLQPGEAAAFVLLEPLRAARRRGARVHGLVTAVGVVPPDGAPRQSAPGVLLGRAVAEVVTPEASERVWFISDLNGEPGRALEWGHFLVRLASTHPALPDSPAWYPATSLGDTGAASGAIGLCAAVRAFARGYAPAEAALVLSSSEGPARGALRVERFTEQ